MSSGRIAVVVRFINFYSNLSSTGSWYSGENDYNVQSPQEAVKAPQLSQIPGLADKMPYEDNAKSSASAANAQNFRDSDSAYVRLAKGGGRHDLLHDQPDSTSWANQQAGRKKHTVEQYRPDWYYHNDDATPTTTKTYLYIYTMFVKFLHLSQ